jgi:hypothetical protein
MRNILRAVLGMSPPIERSSEVPTIRQTRNDPGEPRIHIVSPKKAAKPSKEPKNGVRKLGDK